MEATLLPRCVYVDLEFQSVLIILCYSLLMILLLYIIFFIILFMAHKRAI